MILPTVFSRTFMKKILPLLLISLVCCRVNAQHINIGVRFSGGLGTQELQNSDITKTDNIKTWNVAAIAEMPIQYGFWLQTGLALANKGSVMYEDALTTTTHLAYLQLPANIIYKFDFPGLGKFYAGAGGYIARGLYGHFDYETPSSQTSDKVAFGNQNDFKAMDVGASFVAGLELTNKLTFSASYSLGLNNIASQPQKDTGTSSIKNRLFTIGLGYLIR